MTTEEKAKAWDEAIERAKSKIRNDKDHVLYEEDILDIFPSLKESDEERIRKEIVNFINHKKAMGSVTPEESKRTGSWVAWVEKQGEQKPIEEVKPKFRVGDVIRLKGYTAEYTIESISGECYHGKGWGLHISCDDDYELVKQNNAWSKEDENLFRCAIDAIKQESKVRTDGCLDEEVGGMVIDWLKSLKERVLPKPKQEWSEKDKCMLNNVIDTLKPLSQTTHSGYAINSMIDWLKSLKPQNTWKPSEYELKVLKLAAEKDGACLMGLYQQLKKLRGE